MTPTPTQVRAALDNRPVDDDVLASAARAWLGLFTECETCDGKGTPSETVSMSQMRRLTIQNPCPACGGRGYTLNEKRLEAAAEVTEAWEWGQHRIAREYASSIILAYLGEPRP